MYPITGSDHDGTAWVRPTLSLALGATNVRIGRPNSFHPSSNDSPLSSDSSAANSEALPLYGLSAVFRVAGTVASDDATLSELSLSGVTLSPSFAADTLTYTGSVDNAVTSTAVTATANDDGATVAIVPADADDTADGHQVTLGVGDTTVSVTVIAEDGTTMQTYAVTVTRAAEELVDTTVSTDWGLIPSGLGAGARFRLIFISSTTRNGTATDIADYNTFIQNLVSNNGHTDIRSHSSTFRVVGSTADVDARDYTATRYTGDNTVATDDDSDLGVAIYWLDGNKVADQYRDFYDGDWDDEANAKDESGSNRSTSGNANQPMTGSDHDGKEVFGVTQLETQSRGLGATFVRVGRPNDINPDYGPLSSAASTDNSNARPLYGLSGVFVVVPPPQHRAKLHRGEHDA